MNTTFLKAPLQHHYFNNNLHLVIAQQSIPRSRYLAVIFKEFSSKCLFKGIRIDPFHCGDS